MISRKKSVGLKTTAITFMVAAAIAAGISGCSSSGEIARTELPEKLDVSTVEQQTSATKPEQQTSAAKPEQQTSAAKPEQQTSAAKPEQQTSVKNEFLGTNIFGIVQKEVQLPGIGEIEPGTWIHLLFEQNESYTIQWGYDTVSIPKDSVSISDRTPRWESARTAGMITPGFYGIVVDLDPCSMNHEKRGTYVTLSEDIHPLGANLELPQGTVLLIWGTYDENYLIVGWYDQYMIVPQIVQEIQLEKWWELPDGMTSAGYMFDPLVLPQYDIHWQLSPTKSVEIVADIEAFLHGLPRESVILHTGKTFTVYDLGESPSRWYAWDEDNDSIIFIPKEATTVLVQEPVG